MDPWADEGPAADAGPSSWNAVTAVAASPVSSPSRLRSDTGPADPWAEGAPANVTLPSVILPPIPVNDSRPDTTNGDTAAEGADEHTRDRSGSLGNTFDPWGSGSAPISSYAGGRDEGKEVEPALAASWHPDDVEDIVGVSAGIEHPVKEVDDEGLARADAAPLDEDDPWGSGAQARRLKEDQAAKELAQRMEIIRLQEEAKGKSFDDGEREEPNEEGRHSEERAAEATAEEKQQTDAKAPAAASGWRSLFGRATTKTAVDETKPRVDTVTSIGEQQKSADVGDAPRSSSSITAPRLWQAPSLRSSHGRNTSVTSLGSAAAAATTKESAAASSPATASGPGWEVAPKKPTSGSGGFIQNFLGVKDGGQTSSSSTSALSRFGQSLQRPQIVSAQDQDLEDDSIDAEGTGIEWEAGDTFDGPKQQQLAKQQPQDLLGSDDQAPEQGSAVARILGKWRGKPEEGKKKDGISGDDLSWLENISEGQQGQVGSEQKANSDEDWLAFVKSNNDVASSGGQQRPSQSTPKQPLFAAAGPTINIPYAGRSQAVKPQIPTGPLQPPPRFNGPSHRQQNTLLEMSPDPEDEASFGSYNDTPQLSSGVYRDEPDSHDDALLRQQERQRVAGSQVIMPQQQPHRRKTGASGLLAGLTGRPIRAYTFDDEDEGRGEGEGVYDGWSAFRDAPSYSNSGVTRTQQSKETTASGMRLGDGVRDQPSSPRSAKPLSAVLAQPPSRTSTPSSTGSGGGGGILPPPPPPSAHRVQSSSLAQPPSAPIPKAPMPTPAAAPPAKKALSQGTTLTHDDLSFFETL